jgi:hypothetical protein
VLQSSDASLTAGICRGLVKEEPARWYLRNASLAAASLQACADMVKEIGTKHDHMREHSTG